jgi:hypothetical protein
VGFCKQNISGDTVILREAGQQRHRFPLFQAGFVANDTGSCSAQMRLHADTPYSRVKVLATLKELMFA